MDLVLQGMRCDALRGEHVMYFLCITGRARDALFVWMTLLKHTTRRTPLSEDLYRGIKSVLSRKRALTEELPQLRFCIYSACWLASVDRSSPMHYSIATLGELNGYAQFAE